MLRREKEKGTEDFGEIKAFLGEGTEFKGVLTFHGTVRVDGRLEGEIIGDDLLIVGEPAFVKAEIDVGRLVVSGRIEGNITAKKRVEILNPGVVTGNIKTPALIVNDGATFNGSCDMGKLGEEKVVQLESGKEVRQLPGLEEP
jgi:cytoskeletal protein CcmA (bactofilin family)